MTKIIAHRGASGYAPENTMEAFEMAIKMGADMIETDVHLSKDSKLIIMHDERIDRTTNGFGFIFDYTYEELSKFNANNHMEQYGFTHIPLLSELLALIKKTGTLLNIELKTDHIQYPNIEKLVNDLVIQYEVEEQVIYSSFNHYSLDTLKKINPNAKIGLLYMEGLFQPWQYAKMLKADALHPYYPNLKIPNYLDYTHQTNIQVNAWTVNKKEDIQNLLEMKIDGIITNYPDIAIQLRQQIKD